MNLFTPPKKIKGNLAGDCADCLSITQIHGKDDEKTEHGFYMLEQFSDNGDLIKSQKLKLSAVIEEK